MEGLYISLSGALVEEQRLQIIANDLANLNTPGHKRQRLSIVSEYPLIQAATIQSSDPDGLATEPVSTAPMGDQIFARVDRSEIDFSQGALRTTGLSTDLALEGSGFFVVDVNGEDHITRAGAFTLDTTGTLVMRVGDEMAPVLGDAGPIVVDSPDFQVFADGSVQSRDGSTIATLRVVDFDDPQLLARRGNSLFSDTEGQAGIFDVPPAERTVRQGSLELSNADAVPSLVAMIEIQRAFQAMTKAMATIDEAFSRRLDAVTQ
jgi:flagellar basal-body rod protein FlgG